MQNIYNWDLHLASEVNTDPIFEYPDTQEEPNLKLLALPPPKRFLDEGSVFWQSPDTRYSFMARGNPARGHGKHMHVLVDKFHFNYPYVRLMGISYYFLRDKNCMQEQKKLFTSLVYNLESRILYTVKGNPIYKNGKCIRVGKVVKRVSLNKLHIRMGIAESFHKSNLDKFINTVKDKILEDVPDVYDECTEFKTRLIALNIQHRIGKPIPALNDTFVANLQPLVMHERFRHKHERNAPHVKTVDESRIIHDEIDKKVKADLNKTIYRFIPTLKKTGSLKKALRTLITEEYYISILPTLIQNVDFDNVAMQGRFMQFLKDYEKNVPKPIKHELTRLTKSGDFAHITELMSHLVDMINDDHISKRIKDAWVRTMLRIGEPVSWTTWRDMYNMAGLLGGLRIRPNRFETPNDIQELHDTYSTVMRARSPSKHKLPKELMTFLEIDCPEEVFITDHMENKYTFIQLLNPQDLLDESDIHSHCVHSYADGCFEGRSVIFRLLINSEPIFTVEYEGETLHFIQAEGATQDGMRHFPGDYIMDEVIKPFSHALSKRENKKPLNYKVRAGLRADLIKLWTDLSHLENHEGNDELVEEHFEVLNCDLENRIEITKALDNGNISHQAVLEKLAKVKRHTANQLAVNRNVQPRQIAPAPPGDFVVPTPAVPYDVGPAPAGPGPIPPPYSPEQLMDMSMDDEEPIDDDETPF